jgi:hypothetical protein
LDFTVTGNWHVAWLPEKSVAVQVTIVVPRGKRLPDGGTHTRLGVVDCVGLRRGGASSVIQVRRGA